MLTVKNLSFHYPKSRPVLQSINMELKPGNIYGLFGKNGEGKSTLIKIMIGLLFPKSGVCGFGGMNTHKRDAQTLQRMFLVPEDFDMPALSIETFQKINAPFYPNFSQEQFYKLIEEFKLSSKAVISRLSFGQKKKVLIAFGISANTELLLMDEPTNGLDIPSKSQFRKVMASAVDDGKCIVIATHQVRDLHSLINHVMILDDANVVFDRSLETISGALWFGKANASNQADTIYSESSFGGRSVLIRGDKEETEVDLELLFNGVLNETQKINTILENIDHGRGV